MNFSSRHLISVTAFIQAIEAFLISICLDWLSEFSEIQQQQLRKEQTMSGLRSPR